MAATNAPQSQSQRAIDAQLRDLDRQGGDMARLAHVAAGSLLLAFSAGSLISISHAAFVAFLAHAQAGQVDIPNGLSLIVNVLLVLAADIALLYAASVLRVLIATQAPARDRRIHIWAMWGASALEASTYLYLAWQFDQPTTAFLWIIVVARAVAAPLFAAYLSMARALPVTPRDVAYHSALASGKGMVRDVAKLAADPDALLARKVRIYKASALMPPGEERRFDAIIEAVSDEQSSLPENLTSEPPYTAEQAITAVREQLAIGYPPAVDAEPEPEPPSGGGAPATTSATRPLGADEMGNVTPIRRNPTRRPATPRRRAGSETSEQDGGTTPVRRKRVRTARRKTGGNGQSLETTARAAWASGARSVNAMVSATGMSRNAASGWVRTLKAEQTQTLASPVVVQEGA